MTLHKIRPIGRHRRCGRALAIAAACAVELTLAFFAGRARAGDGPRVHLKGTSRIDAHIGRLAGKPSLSGSLTDDARRSVPKALVYLQVGRAVPGGLLEVALSSAAPEACRDGDARAVLDSGKRIVLATDDAGRFCVRLALPTDRYVAHLETGASKLIDAATLELPFDLALESVSLRFDPAPTILSLDDETTPVDVSVFSGNEDLPAAVAGLALRLSSESGTALGDAVTGAGGHAHFVVPSIRLGPPGAGELRVLFGGTSEIGSTSSYLAIERRSRVLVAVSEATAGTWPIASIDDGIPLSVIAQAGCAQRGCQGAPTGTVEVHFGSVLVGAASLRRGAATVMTSFDAGGANAVELRVSYRPDTPWFLAMEDTRLVQPVRSARPWGKVAIGLAGIGVLAWFIFPRLPSRPRLEPRVCASPAERAIARRVPGAPSPHGFTGRIVDAHDGSPVAGAQVRIERPGFQSAVVIEETTAMENGTFALPPGKTSPGDQLVVASPVYSTLRRPLAGFGPIDVGLVARKRALLERLVLWAKERGGRFNARPDPTPAHIRHVAGPDSPIADWADAVEKAIYGGGIIDAEAQSRIDRLSPDKDEKDAYGTVARGRNPRG